VKPVRARLATARRAPHWRGQPLLGQYDDNTVRLGLRVIDGPPPWLDRAVTLDLSIDSFVRMLPGEFAARLQKALNERLPRAPSKQAASGEGVSHGYG
jgi:hypothetical protein